MRGTRVTLSRGLLGGSCDYLLFAVYIGAYSILNATRGFVNEIRVSDVFGSDIKTHGELRIICMTGQYFYEPFDVIAPT